MTLLLPIATVNPLNKREHWSKRTARVASERALAEVWLRHEWGSRPVACLPAPPPLPVRVTLTRLAEKVMDDDGLSASMKGCRDEIALWLGADDSPGSGITWAYAQRKPTAEEASRLPRRLTPKGREAARCGVLVEMEPPRG